jgi:predicted porin
MSTHDKEATWSGKKIALVGLGIAAAIFGFAWFASDGKAADLGNPNNSADLEERIAELEATVARKGNRKVRVSIEGQINKAIAFVDAGDEKDFYVIENGASESLVRVRGDAQIRPGLWTGFVAEIDLGESGPSLGGGSLLYTDNDLSSRQTYVYVKSDTIGAVSVGLQSTATDDMTQHNAADGTSASTKRLTGQPVLGEMSEIFNGYKANAVKYTSPTVAGFTASAAWDSEGDGWDAKLSFTGEGAGFKIVADAGFLDRNEDGLLSVIDARTVTLNAGVKHLASGLFLQASWARIDVGDPTYTYLPGDGDFDAWHAQGGIEAKFFPVGLTTLFAEYSDWGGGDLVFYGVGINQSLVADAVTGESLVDLYVAGRLYETDLSDEEVTSVLGGARLKF